VKKLFVVAAPFLCIVSGVVASEKPEAIAGKEPITSLSTVCKTALDLFHDSREWKNLPTDTEVRLEGLLSLTEEKSKMIRDEKLLELKRRLISSEYSLEVVC
jgi:hypothetical protein